MSYNILHVYTYYALDTNYKAVNGCGCTLYTYDVYILIYGVCENKLPCINAVPIVMKSLRNRVSSEENDERCFRIMAKELIG